MSNKENEIGASAPQKQEERGGKRRGKRTERSKVIKRWQIEYHFASFSMVVTISILKCIALSISNTNYSSILILTSTIICIR